MSILLPSQVPPAYRCICGKKFYSKPAGMRHTAGCTEADEMVAAEQARRETNVLESGADKEAREWISKRLAEGKPATKRGNPA
jgi:hypothetical protein